MIFELVCADMLCTCTLYALKIDVVVLGSIQPEARPTHTSCGRHNTVNLWKPQFCRCPIRLLLSALFAPPLALSSSSCTSG